jgi:hypothetical protein
MTESTINTRHLVIELSIYVEESVSQTLGLVLGIDWKKSKSLGFQSSCLSFNQKISLIQDLKGIGKDDRIKLEHLMSIRNKFAHVRKVNSFEKFLTISNKKELPKDLRRWYPSKNENPEDIEKTFLTYFIKLVFDLNKILTNISISHLKQNQYETWKKKMDERIINNLKDALLKVDGGSELFLSTIDKVAQETNK